MDMRYYASLLYSAAKTLDYDLKFEDNIVYDNIFEGE